MSLTLFPLVFILAIGGLVTFALLGTFLVKALGKSGNGSRSVDLEELGSEGRKLLRPLKQDREEIQKIIDSNRDKPHIQSLGQEVLRDVDGLIDQAARLALRASALKKLMKGKGKAEQAVNDLKDRLKNASSESERSAYEDALAARAGEIKSYDSVQAARGKVEAAILQAHARVSEIKSLLIASAVQTNVQTQETEELRRMVDRLQSMRTTLDEAEALLQDT
jgi:predicted dinucleotide-utilizing enzyme